MEAIKNIVEYLESLLEYFHVGPLGFLNVWNQALELNSNDTDVASYKTLFCNLRFRARMWVKTVYIVIEWRPTQESGTQSGLLQGW